MASSKRVWFSPRGAIRRGLFHRPAWSVIAVTDHIAEILHGLVHRCITQPNNGTTKMKSSRVSLLAFAAVVGLVTLTASANYSPASAGQFDWLSNKDYVHCLQLFATGDFLTPANATSAQRAALHEKGRHYCNRTYYGHD